MMDTVALTILLTCSLTVTSSTLDANDGSPNVVVLLADDLGIGDVGCYGNETIMTPNIDKLCRQGVKFTHHLSAASLCTPSRAAFLTGRLPLRMGLSQGPGTAPVVIFTAGRAGLPANETTWADVLSRNGYQTAAIGKWHMGWDETWKGDQVHGPLGHGFQYFFGLPFTLVSGFELNPPFFTYSGWNEKDNPLHSHFVALSLSLLTVCAVYSKNFGYTILALVVICFFFTWFFIEHFAMHKDIWWRRSYYMEKFLNSLLMEGTKVAEQPIELNTLTEKLTSKAIDFLHGTNESGQPFALYFAFPNVHTPLVPGKEARGKTKHGAYGDSIFEMDLAIGKILDTLDEMGQADNTLVFFASDHGSHINIGREGGSNRPFRGGKGIGATEGGIRIPAIMRWPGVVKPESTISAPTSLLDFLPTMQAIVQDGDGGLQLDGQSYLPLLKEKEPKNRHRVMRHYCGTNLFALRFASTDGQVYKAHFREPVVNEHGHCGFGHTVMCPCHGEEIKEHKRPVLYDVESDPEELSPIPEDDDRYRQLLPEVLSAFEEAENEWQPPSQFASMSRVMPMPWLQPCARFPLCKT